MEIGSIEKVPIREVWEHEEKNFTPWLSKNLHELEKQLGISTITNVETEVDAGSFSCDISGNIGNERIIIENLLEETDHDHLGKCITYASMLKASYIVFIAKSFGEEHLTAIDWLNEQFKAEAAKFFAVTISAVKIGNSEPAALFKVLREPDDYQKEMEEERTIKEGSARLTNRKSFWQTFLDEYGQINPSWKNLTANHYPWQNRSAGTSETSFSASFRGSSHHSKPVVTFYKNLVEYKYFV